MGSPIHCKGEEKGDAFSIKIVIEGANSLRMSFSIYSDAPLLSSWRLL